MKVTVRYQYDPMYGEHGYYAFIDLPDDNILCASGKNFSEARSNVLKRAAAFFMVQVPSPTEEEL